ncbi:hypothetical protein KY362_02095, partial [Candidatus Woesearchaeota archaeon]|nr:hypothetical protein [Candidatus Woesearchaeota archaeon]
NTLATRKITQERPEPERLVQTPIRDQVDQEAVPEEYLQKSEEFLKSMYGDTYQYITFKDTEVRYFSGWGGCHVYYGKDMAGRKFIVEYEIDYSAFIEDTETGQRPHVVDTGNEIKVVYHEDGELYCTNNVVNCIAYPEYCPPYEIDNSDDAIRRFEKDCGLEYNNVFFGNYNSMGAVSPIKEHESRWYWTFMQTDCGRHCQMRHRFHMDPNTGELVEGHDKCQTAT